MENDFEFYDLVRYEDKLYVIVEDEYLDEGKLGVAPEENLQPGVDDYDEEPKIIWLPPEKLEKVQPVKADRATVQAFFRLEKSSWDLAREGKYLEWDLLVLSGNIHTFTNCFAEGEPLIITAEDLLAAMERLITTDSFTARKWFDLLCNPDNPIQTEKDDELTSILLGILRHAALLYCHSHAEDVQQMQKWHQHFLKLAATPIDAWDIADPLEYDLFFVIECLADKRDISDGLRSLYLRLLDDENGLQENRRALLRGEIYSQGNKLVSRDWHKVEQALLKAYRLNVGDDNDRTAVLLGNLYSSDNLGAPDYTKAFYYFSAAAAAGNSEARYKLADMYRLGRGTPADPAKAVAILTPLYANALTEQWYGYYSVLPETALLLGYCAREGQGRAKSLRDAYCLFRQAKHAVIQRNKDFRADPDTSTLAAIDRALEELLHIYSPLSENRTGLVGRLRRHRALVRCLADEGDTLLVRTLGSKHAEMRVPRPRFIPLTEHSREVGETVTIAANHQSFVISGLIWDSELGIMQYIRTIEGEESEWYSEWALEGDDTHYALKYMTAECGPYLYPTNPTAYDRFYFPVNLDELPLSPQLRKDLKNLPKQYANKHGEAMNPNHASGSPLWSEDERQAFNRESYALYQRLCQELGEKYQVEYFGDLV